MLVEWSGAIDFLITLLSHSPSPCKPSPDHHGSSSQDLSQQWSLCSAAGAITLEANACLEWLPQETILFNQAQYQQNLRVDLAPGATFCGWEIVRLGRSARQESFNQGCWQITLDVWQGGQPCGSIDNKLRATNGIACKQRQLSQFWACWYGWGVRWSHLW